jgi:hypothetical protein
MPEPIPKRILMRKLMAAALLALAATGTACKKGGGGYIQTAPAPVTVAR